MGWSELNSTLSQVNFDPDSFLRKDCSYIDEESSNQFARIWIYCITAGTVILTATVLPYIWAGFFTSPKVRISDSGEVQDGESGKPVVPPKPIKKKDPATSSRMTAALGASGLNWEDARAHLKETSPLDEQGNWRPVCGTPIGKLREVGGVGTELYFRLLIVLGICFVVMGVLNMPLIAFSLHGDFAPDTGPRTIRTTVGNLGNVVPGVNFRQEARQVIVGCQATDVESLTKWFGWLDFLAVVFFLVLVAHFHFYTIPAYVRVGNATMVTASDFAVEIDCLPERIEEHARYEELLRQHIHSQLEGACGGSSSSSSVPRVREVALARYHEGKLGAVMQRAEQRFRLSVAKDQQNESKVSKIKEEIEELDTQIGEALGAETNLTVSRAYIILNTTEDVRNLLRVYRFSNYAVSRWCQHIPCFQHYRFQGHSIRVKPAPEPTNIIWENLDISQISRFVRWVISNICWVIILCIALAIVYAFKMMSQTKADIESLEIGAGSCGADQQGTSRGIFDTAGGYKCDPLEAATWTLEVAQRLKESIGGEDGNAIMDCFCMAQGHSVIVHDPELRDACQSWLVWNSAKVTFNTLAAVVVVGVNVGLNYACNAIALAQKITSVSGRDSAAMIKLAIAMTLNTGFMVFFVNYKGLFFDGSFDDFERGWYAVVAPEILTVMMMNVCSVPCSYLAYWGCFVLARRCCGCRTTHQVHLLEMFTNPPFDLSGRFACLLSTVFVTLTYGSGLPFLYPTAAVYCFICYWADKLVLLKGSSRPPAFEGTMARQSTAMLLIAVPLHCLFACMMYGHPCVFPSNPLGGHLDRLKDTALSSMQNYTATSTDDVADGVGERVTKEATWMFFVLLMVCVGLALLWFTLYVGGSFCFQVMDCLRACCCSCCAGISGHLKDKADQMEWNEAARLIAKLHPPASYKMRNHPSFDHISMFLFSEDGLGVGGEEDVDGPGESGKAEEGAGASS